MTIISEPRSAGKSVPGYSAMALLSGLTVSLAAEASFYDDVGRVVGFSTKFSNVHFG